MIGTNTNTYLTNSVDTSRYAKTHYTNTNRASKYSSILAIGTFLTILLLSSIINN